MKKRINSLQLQNKVLLLPSQKLSYGVMVTQQILVLLFQVRILVAQPRKRETSVEVSLFYCNLGDVFRNRDHFLIRKFLVESAGLSCIRGGMTYSSSSSSKRRFSSE